MTATVRHFLLAAAKGTETLAALAGPTPVGMAASAAAALITGIASLLKTRTAEEVRTLILDLDRNPADRVDLSGLDEEIAEIIRARRAADDTRETT